MSDNKRRVEDANLPLSKEEVKKLKGLKRDEEELERIIEFNNKRYTNDASSSITNNMITPMTRRKSIFSSIISTTSYTPGSYVYVEADTSPNMNRPSGKAWIIQASTDNLFTIKMSLDSSVHNNVPRSAVSIVPFAEVFGGVCDDPFITEPKRSARIMSVEKNKKESVEIDNNKKMNISTSLTNRKKRELYQVLLDVLEKGSLVNKPKGWLREELMIHPFYHDINHLDPSCKKRMEDSIRKQKKTEKNYCPSFSPKEKNHFLRDYELLDTYLHITKVIRKQHKINKSNKDDYKTIKYLMYSYGINLWAQIGRWKNELVAAAVSKGIKDEDLMLLNLDTFDNEIICKESIIENASLAAKLMTPRYVYVKHHMHEYMNSDACIKSEDDSIGAFTKRGMCQMKKRLRDQYDVLDEHEKDVWQQHAKDLIAWQPHIKDTLMQAMRQDSSVTYKGLEQCIQHWCSYSTIQRWVVSREGYRMYTEKVVPLLSKTQKEKHFTFAKRVLDNWGVEKSKKFLWIHYDEKWFWGMLFRKTAKTFDDLPKSVVRAYHKNHISKTMGIAFVAFAFDDTIENGGTAVKVRFERAQSNKIARRKTRNKEGKVLRERNQEYLVDCNVTGSSNGTARDP